LSSSGTLHFFWQHSSIDSLVAGAFLIEDDRRIKKALRAIIARIENRMIISLFMALVSFL